MNYIVMDLEWNQSSSGQIGENPRLPFEIIEIGATKLDHEFNIVDQYGSIIKPRVYRRLQPKIREILNYDEVYLKTGRPFDVVFREFKKWCGDDYIFCTWGASDLVCLQQNMDFYYLKGFSFPLKFYNLQEIYALDHYSDRHQAPSLEKAVGESDISIDKPFHSAQNDAYYTARIFQKMNHAKLSDMYSIDCYRYPTCMDEEITSKHLNYSEYITRTFHSKKEALDDKNITSLRCHKCNRRLSKKIKWFVSNSNTQICVGKCWSHGLICGRIRFKPARDGDIFVVKTTEKINKTEYERIRERQNTLRIRRREKRIHKSNVS